MTDTSKPAYFIACGTSLGGTPNPEYGKRAMGVAAKAELKPIAGGMIGDSLPANVGADLNGSFGQIAGSGGEGAKAYFAMAKEAGFDGTGPYSPESYDAAALFMLAMQSANSTDPADYVSKILEVANAPGEKIYPGELAKGLELIKAGTDIDYVGASDVELIGPGESAGSYREIEVTDGENKTVKFH